MNDFQDKAFKGPWTLSDETVVKSLGGGRIIGLSIYCSLSLKGRRHPVWACSYSCRRGLQVLATEDYTTQERDEAERQMDKAMRRVGDKTRQRCFRTGMVFFIERALNDLEIARLPKDWPHVLTVAPSIPLEVLWSTVEECPSHQPCASPGWTEHPEEPKLMIPVGCGVCSSCAARAQVIEREKESDGGMRL